MGVSTTQPSVHTTPCEGHMGFHVWLSVVVVVGLVRPGAGGGGDSQLPHALLPIASSRLSSRASVGPHAPLRRAASRQYTRGHGLYVTLARLGVLPRESTRRRSLLHQLSCWPSMHPQQDGVAAWEMHGAVAPQSRRKVTLVLATRLPRDGTVFVAQ